MFTTIEGKVYDITDFVNKHPGGAMMAQLAVNRDSTYMFWSYHTNQKHARQILDSLPQVGTVDTKYMKPDFLFYLQSKIRQFRKKLRGGMNHRLYVWLPLCAVFSYLICIGYWQVSAILGFIFASIGLTIQHDANHGAFSKNPTINNILGYTLDIMGRSSFMWRLHHNVGHHIYTNEYDKDIDVSNSTPLLRLHEKDTYRWYHAYQHYYWPFVFLFSSIGEYTDITTFIMGKDKHITVLNRTWMDIIMFYLFKILHFTLYFIIPYYYYGQWYSFIIMHVVGNYYLAIQFVISHATENIHLNLKNYDDWAIKQISESSNWATESKLVNYFTGGLNCQIEHHLFPCISDHHYPDIAHIIQEECKIRNIPYTKYDSIWQNIKSYVALLKVHSTKK